MNKTAFLLLVSTCILNGCHPNTSTTTIPAIPKSPAPVKDTAKTQVVLPQPIDTTVKDGQVIRRYANGIIKEKSYYVAGRRQGECQYFYPNGKMWSDDYFSGGLIDGATTSYYDNGQKQYEGTCSKGVPTGIWKFYDNTGKLLRTKNYGGKTDNPVM